VELAPPLAWSFFASVDIDAEARADEPRRTSWSSPRTKMPSPKATSVEPEGAVVVPARRGAVAGLVARGQRTPMPSATETASAIGVNLM
jgi:hypothetical protein